MRAAFQRLLQARPARARAPALPRNASLSTPAGQPQVPPCAGGGPPAPAGGAHEGGIGRGAAPADALSAELAARQAAAERCACRAPAHAARPVGTRARAPGRLRRAGMCSRRRGW